MGFNIFKATVAPIEGLRLDGGGVNEIGSETRSFLKAEDSRREKYAVI